METEADGIDAKLKDAGDMLAGAVDRIGERVADAYAEGKTPCGLAAEQLAFRMELAAKVLTGTDSWMHMQHGMPYSPQDG